jgi:hypothetical protein
MRAEEVRKPQSNCEEQHQQRGQARGEVLRLQVSRVGQQRRERRDAVGLPRRQCRAHRRLDQRLEALLQRLQWGPK